jgi:hypothetical protein
MWCYAGAIAVLVVLNYWLLAVIVAGVGVAVSGLGNMWRRR